MTMPLQFKWKRSNSHCSLWCGFLRTINYLQFKIENDYYLVHYHGLNRKILKINRFIDLHKQCYYQFSHCFKVNDIVF